MDLAEALFTIELLQGQITAQEKQLAERDEKLRELKFELELKCYEIARFKRAMFGDRSERVAPEEMVLPGIDLSPLSGAPLVKPIKVTKVKAHERIPRLIPNRPRLELDPSCVTDKEVILLPDECNCKCCGEAMVSKSEEKRVVIEREPARYTRTTFIRPKMLCAHCGLGGVVIAEVPEPQVTGAGPVGTSLAVDIVLMHYQDHLPFHRLSGIFKREGLQIDRSTLSRVSGRVADLLSPRVDWMEAQLLGSDNVVGIDGTGLKIMASPHCQRRVCYVLHGLGSVVLRMLMRESADHVLEGFESFQGSGALRRSQGASWSAQSDPGAADRFVQRTRTAQVF